MAKNNSGYRVWIKLKNDPLISGTNFKTLEEALSDINNELPQECVTEIILIDNLAKIVELIKGNDIKIFKKSLNKRLPGWKLGTIKK